MVLAESGIALSGPKEERIDTSSMGFGPNRLRPHTTRCGRLLILSSPDKHKVKPNLSSEDMDTPAFADQPTRPHHIVLQFLHVIERYKHQAEN
jgi:hypothetical protein